MSIVQQMRTKLTESMKAKDAVRTQFLRYWIAGLTKGDGTEYSETESINRMRGVLKEARSGSTTFTDEEIALLQEWVPATLTAEQVVDELASVAEAIKAAPKDGMAMGVAMKALAGKPVDSQDVKAAIATIRGTS